jgi:hypothetical protein
MPIPRLILYPVYVRRVWATFAMCCNRAGFQGVFAQAADEDVIEFIMNQVVKS